MLELIHNFLEKYVPEGIPFPSTRTYSLFTKSRLFQDFYREVANEAAGELRQAFNLAVKLTADGNLNEFYNAELTLEYYRYPKLFLRRAKNVYFSFIPSAFMQEIGECNAISHSGLKRRLRKHGLPCRLQDLRHYYATFMVKHGLLREEADLLQGRVNRSVFMRHYFTPSMKELKHRVLENVMKMLLEL